MESFTTAAGNTYTMKMSRGVIICFLLAVLALTCESSYQRFKSIRDLKKIDFGQSVPKHILVLLHWFANELYTDSNGVTWLTFEPNMGDYGSHHYGNYERLLEPLPRGYRYFTLGNLNEGMSSQLPDYVVQPPSEYEGTNRDRIIFRVREEDTEFQPWQRIDQVYITQHYSPSEHQGTMYDPDHTYQVTPDLLREIAQFSVGGNQNLLLERGDHFDSNIDDSELWNLMDTWGNLACLGLFLFIVIQKNNSIQANNRAPYRMRRDMKPDCVVNMQDNWEAQRYQIQLYVRTSNNGNAVIVWRNVPQPYLDIGVMVILFQGNSAETSITYKVIVDSNGSYDTSKPLSEGFQVRLHKKETRWFFLTAEGPEICRGPEFHSPNKVMIPGYNASLQLFVQDGKACARLYVKKTFSKWKSEFVRSWVGFYTSAHKSTDEYEFWKWQWATKFSCSYDHNSLYNIFEYDSGMTIAPGVQARFILMDFVEKARTPACK